jgi:hypothetical protein
MVDLWLERLVAMVLLGLTGILAGYGLWPALVWCAVQVARALVMEAIGSHPWAPELRLVVVAGEVAVFVVLLAVVFG